MNIQNSGSAALQLLQQAPQLGARTSSDLSSSASMTFAASGVKTPQVSGLSATLKSASSQAASAFFDASQPNINKLKMDLFKRTGEALGVREEDFETQADYGAALRSAVAKLKNSPDAQLVMRGIEQKLGLDDLGISLDTVIDAISDPTSDAEAELTKALEHKNGVLRQQDGSRARLSLQPRVYASDLD